MKKILLLSLTLFVLNNLSVKAVEFNTAPVENFSNQFWGMQSPENQFKLMEQQRFRQEEYNEFKDMKTQKEERNKKINLQKQLEETHTVPSYNQDVDIIQENNELKIKKLE